jgi:hypothetical protein
VPQGVPPARGLVLVDSANRLELMTAQRGLGDVEAATDIACRKAVGYTGECRAWAHVAQEAEHNLGKIEVPGSSPGVGSRSRCSSAVEQLFRKQQVVGSNPTTGSLKNLNWTRNFASEHRRKRGGSTRSVWRRSGVNVVSKRAFGDEYRRRTKTPTGQGLDQWGSCATLVATGCADPAPGRTPALHHQRPGCLVFQAVNVPTVSTSL